MQKQATITSKGQITVPREIRRVLGVRSGDKLLFVLRKRTLAPNRSHAYTFAVAFVAALATPKFRRVEKVLLNGCAG